MPAGLGSAVQPKAATCDQVVKTSPLCLFVVSVPKLTPYWDLVSQFHHQIIYAVDRNTLLGEIFPQKNLDFFPSDGQFLRCQECETAEPRMRQTDKILRSAFFFLSSLMLLSDAWSSSLGYVLKKSAAA